MGEWIQKLLDKFWEYMIPFVVINDYERGVMLRLGRMRKVLNPGWYFKFPIVDIVLKEIVAEDTKETFPVYISTIDNHTVVVTPVISFEILDIEKWMLKANDGRSNLYDLTSAATSTILAQSTWEQCKQKETLINIQQELNNKVEYMGVRINDYYLGSIAPCRLLITKI